MCFLMIRRPPRSTRKESSAASDVYKRQPAKVRREGSEVAKIETLLPDSCLLYTSDAADDSLRVDLGGRRIIKK
ncbi:hypothetical protein, partial [Staphylococcus aureus]